MSSYVPAGRLNGIHAEVGTVLGPKAVTREYVVVTSNDDKGVTVGYAHPEDLSTEAVEAMRQRGPRSITEAMLIRELSRRREIIRKAVQSALKPNHVSR